MTRVNKTKKVCYILSYYSPNYVRTTTLVAALKGTQNLILFEARNNTTGILRYFQTLLALFLIRIKHDPEYYILGFRGYEIFWVVRLITWGKCLIFDHMMSPYDSLLNERKRIKPGGLFDKLVYHYEKSILKHANIILTDTSLHRDYFLKLFQLNPDKIFPVYVGTDEDIFNDLGANVIIPQKELFEVFFYGSFQPLHGVEIILKAAALLSDIPVRFTLVGGNNKNLSGFYRLVEELELKNISHQLWVDYQHLPELMRRADLCLGGPFGNTGQARRVITGKTFQFLAMGKPAVVGAINQNDGFKNKENCLLVAQGDEDALADTIRWGYRHRDELLIVGGKGRELYDTQFSNAKIKHTIQLLFGNPYL